MRADAIDQLLGCLEHLANRPGMFRDVVPPRHELSYMTGVGVGVQFMLDLANDPRKLELRRTAAVTRGWTTDRHPYEQMQKRGFSADEVLSELARLEAEFIRLARTGAGI